jgi:hypothetical protein
MGAKSEEAKVREEEKRQEGKGEGERGRTDFSTSHCFF